MRRTGSHRTVRGPPSEQAPGNASTDQHHHQRAKFPAGVATSADDPASNPPPVELPSNLLRLGKKWTRAAAVVPADDGYDMTRSPLENFERLNARFLGSIAHDAILGGSSSSSSAAAAANAAATGLSGSKVLPPIRIGAGGNAGKRMGRGGESTAAGVGRDAHAKQLALDQKNKQFRSELVSLIMQPATEAASPEDAAALERETMQRYYFYINKGVDTTQVAEMDRRWLDHVLRLIAHKFKARFPDSVSALSDEMCEDYHLSVKKAIVDFVLRDPRDKPDAATDDADNEYSFTNLRTSTPTWQADFHFARAWVDANIIGTNAVLLEVQAVMAKYGAMAVILPEALAAAAAGIDDSALGTDGSSSGSGAVSGAGGNAGATHAAPTGNGTNASQATNNGPAAAGAGTGASGNASGPPAPAGAPSATGNGSTSTNNGGPSDGGETSPTTNTTTVWEVRKFKAAVLRQLETARERLMNGWYPSILNVFYRGSSKKNAWAAIPQAKLPALFNLIALLMTDFLRRLTARAVETYVDMLRGPTPPVFAVRVVAEGGELRTDPAAREIQATLESLVDAILVSFEKVPRIEAQLFAAKGTAPLAVAHEATYPDDVAYQRKVMQRSVARCLGAPQHYLTTFAPHADLVSGKLEAHVRELVAAPVLGPPGLEGDEVGAVPFDRFVDEARRLRDMASVQLLAAFPYSVEFPMVRLSCESILTMLAARAVDLATLVMEKVAAQTRKDHAVLADQYAAIAAQLTHEPTNVEEMAALQKLLDKVRGDDVPRLEALVEACRTRLNMLFQYHDMSKDDYDLNSQLFSWPHRIYPSFTTCEELIASSRRANEEELHQRREKLTTELETLSRQLADFSSYGDVDEIQKYLKIAQKYQTKLDSLGERVAAFNRDEMLFGWQSTPFPLFEQVTTEFAPYMTLYSTAVEFQKSCSSWIHGSLMTLDAEKVENDVTSMWRNVYKILSVFETSEPTAMAQKVKEELEQFKLHIPMIRVLCNPGLRERHWQAISGVVGYKFSPEESTTLGTVLERNLSHFLDQLETISTTASKEFSFEKALQKMYSEWEAVEFTAIDYRDTGTQILSAIDDIQMLLDDHIVKTQAMRGSPYIKPFEEESKAWDAKLNLIQEVLDVWLKVQMTWLYLEPIFSSEDIMRQMPVEGKRFRGVDAFWRELMKYLTKDYHVLAATAMPSLLERLQTSFAELELIQRGLNLYLEAKRLYFPRFFFLSNDEMLSILSETRDPTRVQPHLKKCFEGINTLKFEDNLDIAGMFSALKEYIPFMKKISTSDTGGAVEKWLLDVEKNMFTNVHEVVEQAYKAYKDEERDTWVLQWPGQAVLTVSQVFWTRAVENAIVSNSLKQYIETSAKQLSRIVELVRGSLTKVVRSTLEALVVVDVHARDVIASLQQCKVVDVSDFEWLSQMRYYHDKEKGVTVKMINSIVKYGYEYLGNTGRLVITPLTDRCFRTLLGALQLNLGGAPEGPAGTGKTESVKDLAKAIAKCCVVYNCSDGLDYLAMGKFFKGLAASGAWACFDEFNRIDLEVLSVVAQQILTIQRAKFANADTFIFEGTELNLNASCAVFITMNPGYAGRSELPDNLKSLFRPVAMMVPDYTLIAEISLYSFGFVDARSMAVKITATYRLCSEQLSSQDHYDYGMRAVKSVLNAAGALKLKYPQENENIIVLRSISDVNLPKFLSHDIPLFQGILSDLFPGCKLPTPDYVALNAAIQSSCDKMNLQLTPEFREKTLQVYEMMLVRHGFMLVGEATSGKTACYRVLAAALTEMSKAGQAGIEKVQHQVLNPKSITMGQLYGQFDMTTHEWSDGVLAICFRNFASSPSPDRKWVLFDGPVDAVWIENMNTVLDDNKKLCLNSGEIIQLSSSMSMMFEVRDLAVASPATVSRCGMIYMEPRSLGWRPLMKSWINDQVKNPQHATTVAALFEEWLDPSLEFVRKECTELCETLDLNLARSCMNIFQGLSLDYKQPSNIVLQAMMMFSLVWSVGGVLNQPSRTKFNVFFRGLTGKSVSECQFPTDGSVYDYILTNGNWKPWVDQISDAPIPSSARFADILVPTIDTMRYSWLLKLLAKINKQVLLVGPTGTGKTMYINATLRALPADQWTSIFLTFSAQTSAKQTQEFLESKFDKRRKGVYGPVMGRKGIVFVDDLNMPAREVYGAQPPIELLRQWMDHGGWYNLGDKVFQEFVDIQFVAAMGPPGGGRNPVTSRFLRHFNAIGINAFDDMSLSKIFGAILNWHFQKGFSSAIQALSGPIVESTRVLYRNSLETLLPTPAKSHYTFNLRDFSRVIQGILLSIPDRYSDPYKVVRLWVHEVMRVFYDRLVDDKDRLWFMDSVEKTTQTSFQVNFHETLKAYDTNGDGKVDEQEIRSLMFYAVGEGSKKAYDELESVDWMTDLADKALGEFNALSKKQMDLVMFRFAVEHLIRVSRVLLQPQGNMVCVGVGGSGRQSLTRLAAFMSQYELFQVEITKNYGVTEWHDDIKKIMRKAGGEGKPTVFLFSDKDVWAESALEDVNNLLNSGEVPNIFAPDEKSEIIELVRNEGMKRKGAEDAGSLFAFFIERCRELLHVVLCMSPVGEAFRVRLRKFPSIVNCCTIDWYQPWPNDALEMVASKFLSDVEMDDTVRGEVVQTCKSFHMGVRELSERFLTNLRRHNYVTPTSYLELIRTYKSLLSQKRQDVSKLKFRYLNGLEKLEFAGKSVSKMQVDLSALQPQLKVAAEETATIMIQIERDSKEVNETKKTVAADEAVASKKAEEAKAIKDDCEADLSEALPALNAAMSALDTLKKNDIDLIKSMKNPPAGVKLVMEAVCTMKDIKPVKIPDPATGKKVEDFWGPSKTLLGDLKFLDGLKAYDRDNIPPAIMKTIRSKYMENPEFDPEKVKSASSAAEGLCRWVRALESYDRVAKVIGPKKEALAKAEGELNETMKSLEEKRAMLKVVVDKMTALENKFKEMTAKKEALENQVDSVSKQLVRAEKLIGSLGDEQERWTKCAADLAIKYNALTGDVLVSSGIVAYLGAFTKLYRDDCIAQWVKECRDRKIPCSESVSLSSVLGDPVKIRAWTIAGLPNDSFSIDNAITMSNSRRWPLLIDPQGQANRWIKNMEKANSLQIIKLTDSDYLRTLENAIQFGNPVLLENVAEELDPVLEPLLAKQTFKQGGMVFIRLGDSTIEYSNEFRFYITTKLRNPHYLPELSTKVTLLNFMITPEGLEDQLLGIVIAKEKPELEEAKTQLLLQSAENKKQLQEIEDKILEVLSSSSGNILEDESAIQILASSKVLSKTIMEKQAIAEKTEIQIDTVRSGYKPIAAHSSILFFCIAVLANLEPMYQYSLPWFINLFIGSIEKAPKSDHLEERLGNLRKHFTESLYMNVCRSLFEKDKLVFSILLTVAILRAEGKLNGDEWKFLMIGGVGAVDLTAHPNPDASWITESMWAELCRLSRLPAFTALLTVFTEHVGEMRRLFESASPHEVLLPGGLHTNLTSFQRLLVLRCLRYDKLVPAMQQFIIDAMGRRFVEPPPFDLAASYVDASATTPLIFVLSPGADPMSSLLKFADDRKMAGSKVNSISLGQGQGPIAAKMIAKSAAEGSWIVLQNCHLAVSWMTSLEKICEDLTPETVHRDFRLWLTSYPSEKFPVTILQNGVKMTNEPPKGLRANLLKNYLTDPISDKTFHEGCSKQQPFERMLFALCFFHAVVQERRHFGPIGWNIPYEFNDTDLRISARQLRNFLNEYAEVPYSALVYLTAQANYGGRVTDDKDRRTLLSLLSLYYNPNIVEKDSFPLSPSGTYRIPPITKYSEVLEFIKQLPLETKPEVFSLHENADISKNQLETENLLKAIISTQETSGGGGGGQSAESLVFDVATEMLTRLPPLVDLAQVGAKYPVSYSESMNTVLLQECIRFRTLHALVGDSLRNLLKALQGLVVMSSDLEDVNKSIQTSQIPKMWAGKSYPSMKPLAGYFNDLLGRLAFFQSWIDQGPPIVFQLPSFFFTQSFLTGVLQNYARRASLAIDLVALEYLVQAGSTMGVRPEEGVFVNGIYMEGARWDGNTHAIAESHTKLLYDALPVLWLKPGERAKFKTDNSYDCPVYKTLARRGTLSTTGHSTNYVMSMRIPSRHPEEHWVNRGVACVLSLNI
ncbi:dynein heavy chain and region D6 of dynein motor-domain-containing protein [Blastocladiella britannica]|nr:dynein heavy chain and region D6 of dynein motor-domain-containing protein [Blastocladiella britannica]